MTDKFRRCLKLVLAGAAAESVTVASVNFLRAVGAPLLAVTFFADGDTALAVAYATGNILDACTVGVLLHTVGFGSLAVFAPLLAVQLLANGEAALASFHTLGAGLIAVTPATTLAPFGAVELGSNTLGAPSLAVTFLADGDTTTSPAYTLGTVLDASAVSVFLHTVGSGSLAVTSPLFAVFSHTNFGANFDTLGALDGALGTYFPALTGHGQTSQEGFGKGSCLCSGNSKESEGNHREQKLFHGILHNVVVIVVVCYKKKIETQCPNVATIKKV